MAPLLGVFMPISPIRAFSIARPSIPKSVICHSFPFFSKTFGNFLLKARSTFICQGSSTRKYSSSFANSSHYKKLLSESIQSVMVSLHLSTPKYHIGAIDQGTSSTRFLLFDESSKVVLSHSVPVFTDSPKPG